MCSTNFDLNLEDFPQLPRIAPVHNSISYSKSIVKVVSTSSICISKPICNSNVPPSKPVSASFVCTIKPISNRNVRPSKTISPSSVSPIFGSSAPASKPTCAIYVRVSKPLLKMLVLVMYVQVNLVVVVMLA